MGFNSSTHTIQTWRDGGAAPTRRSLKAGALNIPPSQATIPLEAVCCKQKKLAADRSDRW